ncbi:MAG TPA: hypothetical protein VKQ34_00875 [Candidatus Saccharimonadales bacterium]|nr:hypothetical protein [Candidatus Saccharimonadales bacterium]
MPNYLEGIDWDEVDRAFTEYQALLDSGAISLEDFHASQAAAQQLALRALANEVGRGQDPGSGVVYSY